jgi:uncharacterized protein YkwD
MVRAPIRRRVIVVVVAAAAAALSGGAVAQRGGGPKATAGTGPSERPVELTAEEREIFDRTNAYRVRCGLPAVALNPRLTRAARYFAIYMSLTGDFDHDADGRGPGARAAKFGYDWSLVCENIAYRYKGHDPNLQDLPSDFVNGWIRSDGHRKNMLSDEVIECGVGVAVGQNPRHQYSVQVFGKPRGALYSFKIVNDSGASVRYALGRQVYTLRPGHTRIHPDSESFPTSFESVRRGGSVVVLPLARPDVPAPAYRIVRSGTHGATVVTGPP